MANELALVFQITYTPTVANIAAVAPGSKTDTVSMTGSRVTANLQRIGTSEEAIDFGDITDSGYILVRNTDPTNFVEINGDTTPATNYSIRLLATEYALFRVGGGTGNTLFAKADTAICTIQYWLFEA